MNQFDATGRSRRQWEAVAKSRVSKGERGSALEADFIQHGLDPLTARTIIDEAIRKKRAGAIALLIGGVVMAILGLVVTVGTYSAASSSPYGGTYWIWFGPIIAGPILSIVGLVRIFTIRR